MKKFIARCVAILAAAITDSGKGNMYLNAQEIYKWIMADDPDS